ncbi:HNH endonuclease [Methylobacterium sp. WL120]|uniref:HNH endonuclease n=1 Tax=Methylobacterium sp. WL120 TaxID=2603887 RepID=UPI001AEE93CF|nr:HNH endonuclease [Methylobacterium sp. WL120]
MPNGGVRWYIGEPTYGVWTDKPKRFTFLFKRKTYKVHQLVCEAFNGPKPFPKAVVMHDDEDASHNWPSNLIWGTQKENLNYPGFKAQVSERLRGYTLARMQIEA